MEGEITGSRSTSKQVMLVFAVLGLASLVLGLDRVPGFQVDAPLSGSSWQLVKLQGGNGFKSPDASRWAITLPIADFRMASFATV